MQKKNKLTVFTKIARYTAIFSAVLLVLGMIGGAVLSSSHYRRRERERAERNQGLSEIVRQLEFNGLDDSVKEQMASYAARYTEYSNFVVIDGGFRVLYSLNKGFLDGTGKFFGLEYTQNYNQFGVVCNEKGEVLSAHYFTMGDIEALRRLSGNCTVKPSLASVAADTFEEVSFIAAGSEIEHMVSMESGAGLSPDTNMYFAPVSAKNMYLYFLYDSNTPKWSADAGSTAFSQLRNVGAAAAVALFLLYWVSLAVWVFMDASRRNNHPALWGVLTLFTNFVGLIVYLVARPEALVCNTCKEPLQQGYSYCPICGALNKGRCPGCNELVQEQWTHCPYCGTALPTEDSAPEEGAQEPPADAQPAQE